MKSVREIRESLGMTQVELAEKSGITQATISDIERGKVKSPSIDTAFRLAMALGVEAQDIFPVPELEKQTA